jgi:transmembrane sensor
MIREVLTLGRLQALSPDEAAARLAARLSDGPDAAAETVLAAWLEDDPKHAQAWTRAQHALAFFHPLGDDTLMESLLEDARRTARRSWWPRAAAAVAAVVLLAAGALTLGQSSWLPHLPQRGTNQTAETAQAIRYAAPRGLPQQFLLADGSQVTLDTESAIDVSFTPARREVRLISGRAFFDVTHDAQRPFAVRAADREVIAVGTRFDVALSARDVRVVLVQGRVRVAADDGVPAADLVAGQQLVAARGEPAQVTTADVNTEGNWRQGLVTFNDEPLASAVAELNRYSHEQVIVPDAAVGRLRISGVFKAGDPERFARSVSQVHPVHISRAGPNELVITAAN